MDALWIYPLILGAGVLQAWGPPMNGVLRQAMVNPWLASIISFLPILCLLMVLFVCVPRPLPNASTLAGMPWWAPLGGVVGAFAVVAGLMFVDRVGAGPLAAMTITANLLMSLAIDQFGLFGIPVHTINPARAIGAALLAAGVVLIAKF